MQRQDEWFSHSGWYGHHQQEAAKVKLDDLLQARFDFVMFHILYWLYFELFQHVHRHWIWFFKGQMQLSIFTSSHIYFHDAVLNIMSAFKNMYSIWLLKHFYLLVFLSDVESCQHEMGSCNFSTLSKEKKIIRTPEYIMGFYCLEMPVIALYCKNTCHVPTVLSRELDQGFPLLAFS